MLNIVGKKAHVALLEIFAEAEGGGISSERLKEWWPIKLMRPLPPAILAECGEGPARRMHIQPDMSEKCRDLFVAPPDVVKRVLDDKLKRAARAGLLSQAPPRPFPAAFRDEPSQGRLIRAVPHRPDRWSSSARTRRPPP